METTMKVTFTSDVMPLPRRYGGGYILSCTRSATLNGIELPLTVISTKVGGNVDHDKENRLALECASDGSEYAYTFHECWNGDDCYQEWSRENFRKVDGEWILEMIER